MKLKKLLKNIAVEEIKGSKEIEITGICSHSKWVAPGNLFIAKKGMKGEGSKHIAEAVSAGAVAILTDIYDPFLNSVVQIIHKDVASIEASLAENYYQRPHDNLFSVAYTGTNGKTTGTFLTKHLLDGLDLTCGVIGTIEWIVGDYTLPSTHTTPDIVTNHKLFREMIQNNCRAVAMEVSSHALDQERVKGLSFDVAVYTHLTQDHLDYHGTMEHYASCKSKLFLAHAKKAVVNIDCKWTESIMKGSSIPTLTYGIDHKADLQAESIVLSASGMQFHVNYMGECLPFQCGLIGRFNVYNCLAAIGVGLSYGAPLNRILDRLSSFKSVPGRLERVPNKASLNIFVDYAHTDDALRNVLETLKELKTGRLITVFGCGGDRDRTKRPKMGAIVEALSDINIVTSDNPRSESPEAIIQEILTGIQNPSRMLIEPDRKLAIFQAIKMAQKDDIVLIAGKGHETYQILAHKTIDFDDRKVAQEAVLTLNS